MHYRLYPIEPLAKQTLSSWDLVTDRVMGGQSYGEAQQISEDNQWVTCLKGQISLENNGGFIQLQFDLRAIKNLADYGGLYMTWRGQAPAVAAHLKTDDLSHPWQSYKQACFPSTSWKTDYWSFEKFSPYRTGKPLKPAHICRFGLVAIGAAGSVDLCIREFGLYQHTDKRDYKG